MSADGADTPADEEAAPAPADAPESDADDEPRDTHEPEQSTEPTDDPDEDVFAGVYGHNGAKVSIGAALRKGDVHVLLEGPPGSGKSVFLTALESNVPGALYRDGKELTGSKLRDRLKEDPPLMLIDEIDALDNDSYDVLSTPMESGRLVRDSARESYDVEVGTQILAACNDASELPEHIANRFRVLHFDEYDEEEYLNVCSKMLVVEVEWVESEKEARRIAEIVHDITGEYDPRDARDTAKMADSIEGIKRLAMAMHNPDAEIDAPALKPSEVARAKGEVARTQLREVMVEDMLSSVNGDESDESDADEIESAVEEAVEEAANEAA